MDKTLDSYYAEDAIAVEMARRKLMFHNNREWSEIKLWGLFRYTLIRHYLKDGRLLAPRYTPENVTYWVYPSEDYWLNHIKPITEQFTVEELNETFNWDTPSSVYRKSMAASKVQSSYEAATEV